MDVEVADRMEVGYGPAATASIVMAADAASVGVAARCCRGTDGARAPEDTVESASIAAGMHHDA